MNKDKAIQLLERLQDPEPYEPMLTKDAYDAIQMAIDALSADGDTISRKAAIDRATKEHDFFRGAVTVSDKARRDELLNVMCWLGDLPSAQPEIIACGEGELFVSGADVGGMIDRQAAIDALYSVDEYNARSVKAIKELPSAKPTPDQNGDLWITVPDIDKVTRIYVQESKSKFCRIFYEER